jgi:hypothetical protein
MSKEVSLGSFFGDEEVVMASFLVLNHGFLVSKKLASFLVIRYEEGHEEP